jgi:hypothetical protein
MDFKYFLKLQKVTNENGKTYLHGIASGTDIDRDGEKMSPSVIQKFVNEIKSNGLPLTNSHPRAGDVLGDMGKVVDGSMLEDGKDSMFIKAEADLENPAMQYVLKQYSKGKKYGFSIEGSLGEDGVVATWDDKAQKVVREYVDIKPKAISITTEPSYMGSFMDVISKACDKQTKAYTNLDNLKETDMKVKKNTEEVIATQPEAATSENVVKPVVEAEAVVEVKPEEVPVVEAEVKGEPEAVVEVETKVEEKAEVVEAETDEVKEEAAKVEPTTVKEVVEGVVGKSKEEVAEVKKAEGADIAEAIEEVQEVLEEKKEEAIEAAESDRIDELCMKVDQLMSMVEMLIASDKDVHESFKSYSEKTTEVLKTYSDSVEVLKKLPVGKRSLMKATVLNEIEENRPETVKDVVAKFM